MFGGVDWVVLGGSVVAVVVLTPATPPEPVGAPLPVVEVE